MSDTAAHEPTMEEILASIRRIISEDEPQAEEVVVAPEPEQAPLAAAPEPVKAAPEPVLPDEPAKADNPFQSMGDLDVLDLTEPVEPAVEATSIIAEPIIESHPEPVTPPPATQPARNEIPAASLISEATAQTAMSAFGQLANGSKLPTEGRSVEDLVTDMLRPMLQTWLDTHLTTIVEDAVRAEVERLARQARR